MALVFTPKVKIGIVVVVTLLLLIFGFAYFVRDESSSLGNNDNIPNDAMRVLPDEDKVELESRLSQLLEEEKNLPDDPEERYDFYLRKARTQYELGRNREALDTLDGIVDEEGEYTNPERVWFLYANIYYESQDLDRAITSIQRAIEADPADEDNWLVYVGLTQEKDPNQDLNPIYTEALSKTQNDVQILTAYASYLEFKGQKDQAIQQWQKAIEVSPNNRAVYEQEIQRLQTSSPAQ